MKKYLDKKTLTIIGPTSSGKTSAALKLCSELGGEIVSVDSRQIYQYMDIGTGKVPIDNQPKIKKGFQHWVINKVPIWGYDLVKPNDFYSSFDFLNFAIPRINEIISKGSLPVLVGGTGFYFDMLFGDKKMSEIEPDFKLREKLENMVLEELQNKLKILDEDTFQKIDEQNPARLVRAIEITMNKKRAQRKNIPRLISKNFVKIGFTSTRKYLYDRTDMWVDSIWQDGLLDEVAWLLQSPYKNSNKLTGLVYKQAVDHLQNGLPRQEAIQKTKYELHAYIRRQQTYFKKMKGITWIDISQDNKLEKVYNIING